MDKKEKELQDKIFDGIEDVKEYLAIHTCVDEYIYVILWRPIEWIIDYYASLQSKKDGDNWDDFWKKQAQVGVDGKIKRMEGLVSEGTYKAMNALRSYRNRAIYRYDLAKKTSPFTNFDLVCENFYKLTGRKPHNQKKTEEYKTQIITNEFFFKESDKTAGDGEKELFRDIIGSLKNIIESLDGNNFDKVTISCKMESLAQRYAKELLMDAGHNFKYKHDEKNGIFIDDEQESIGSYIDYYTNEKKFKIRKSERRTRESLKILREVRNAAMHNSIDTELFNDLMLVWKRLMQDYFCDDKDIQKVLEETIKTDIATSEAIKALKTYIELDKKYYSKGIFEEISYALMLLDETMTSVTDMKNRYLDQIDKAKSEAEKEEITEKLIEEIERKNTEFFNKQNEETLKEYEKKLETSLGINNYKINGEVRNYLKTALLLSDLLENSSKNNPEVDCAGACIEYTRALELFLFEKIYERYKRYRSDRNWEHIRTFAKKKYDEDRITLGEYRSIFGIACSSQEENSQNFLNERANFISFCKDEMLYGSKTEDEIENISNDEYQKFDNIKVKYRDPSAHRLAMKKECLSECMKDILTGKDAIFPKLMEDLYFPEATKPTSSDVAQFVME